MISGSMVGFEPRIRIPVRRVAKVFESVDAMVDTGFNAWLALPPNRVSEFDLTWTGEGRGVLADGAESRFDVYEATIQWREYT